MEKDVPSSCMACKGFKNSIFHYCNFRELETVDNNKSFHQYKAGEIIFKEKTFPTSLYCICGGKVKVSKYASDGKEVILRIAKESGLLGYSSLLTGFQYSVSALALEDSTICLIPKKQIFNILDNNKVFSEKYHKMLSSSLSDMFKKIGDIAYKPVLGRIAEALLLLSQIYTNINNPTGIIRIKREDLASFTGTVRETAIRTLRIFKEENIIKIFNTEITILNKKKLASISKLYD